MKKLISFLLAALMIFSLCACGSSSNSASDSKQEASTPMESAANDDIAYDEEADYGGLAAEEGGLSADGTGESNGDINPDKIIYSADTTLETTDFDTAVEKLGALIEQYGGFIELSDMLLLSAIDNNLVQATKLLGSQAGRTLDTITREVLNGGTNVQYAEGQVDSRANLCGGSTTDSQNHYLTVDAVRRAVRYLKVMNAPKINGYYAGIIHPDCSYDLMSDPKWVNVKTYSDPDGIYEGEIGRIEGVRFVETSEAKVFTHAGKDYETGTTASGTVTPKASARDVYSTLILGADAYGVTEITGGGLQHIVKQLGSAGTADPLDQRATAGWKATKVAERLVEAYMVRIETCSTFNS